MVSYPPASKVDALTNMLMPEDLKRLRFLLGCLLYCRKA